MKNLFVILVALILFSSCEDVEIGPGPGPLLKLKEVEYPDYSNPVVFMGSDFGNFFKTLYAQGKYDEMINFTSSNSLEKHGKENVLNFYKNNLKFGYEIGKPHSQIIEGNIITLNYDANIIATKRVIRIKVVVENDSCKIVLPELLKQFPS